MKILFVSSGNSKQGISPIVKAQGDSLQDAGIEVDYFTVVGKGAWGYLKNVFHLRKHLKKKKYDIVHAHFSLTGMVASLAAARPLVVSLMGWNVQKPLFKHSIRFFNRFFWDACIVKSPKMKNSLGINNVEVIPNGINVELFKPLDKYTSLKLAGWDANKTHILCAADPKRPIKNTALAEAAFNLLDYDNAELHFLGGIAHEEMVYHFNASDVVILTSKAEGSPNVIKEAMACNCKIVSTDVGDVKERFQDSPFCFIADQDASDIAENILRALRLRETSNTRDLVLNLDSNLIAERLQSLYDQILETFKQ